MFRTILAIALVVTLTSPARSGFREGLAAYYRLDYGTALAEWQPLAEQGDPLAQYQIGILHYRGDGVVQDYGQAAKWFRRAAERGDADAQFNLGLLYADHFPYRQYATARGVRTSPLHQRLAQYGACFGETAGWERANWFLPPDRAAAGEEAAYQYSWGRQNWFDYAAAEHRAVRGAVGLFDMSSFAKFRVEGGDAEAVLQRICANDVAVRPCCSRSLRITSPTCQDLTTIVSSSRD